jgi:hypothetical protein
VFAAGFDQGSDRDPCVAVAGRIGRQGQDGSGQGVEQACLLTGAFGLKPCSDGGKPGRLAGLGGPGKLSDDRFGRPAQLDVPLVVVAMAEQGGVQRGP